MVHVIIIYDLETTGIDTLSDRIIQFAARVKCQTTGFEYNSYVNPENRQMSKIAKDVTGITQESLSRQPNFLSVWKRFRNLFCNFLKGIQEELKGIQEEYGEKKDELVLNFLGHNSANFDDILLAVEFARSGINVKNPFNIRGFDFRIQCADTLKACREAKKQGKITPGNLRLSTLYQLVTQKCLEGAHDAQTDCWAVECLLTNRHIATNLIFESWHDRSVALHKRIEARKYRNCKSQRQISPGGK